MKKYLMTGIAALAMGSMFTSCSHDMSLYNGDGTKAVVEKYEEAFVSAYGEPDANQTWGFGSTSVAGVRGLTHDFCRFCHSRIIRKNSYLLNVCHPRRIHYERLCRGHHPVVD